MKQFRVRTTKEMERLSIIDGRRRRAAQPNKAKQRITTVSKNHRSITDSLVRSHTVSPKSDICCKKTVRCKLIGTVDRTSSGFENSRCKFLKDQRAYLTFTRNLKAREENWMLSKLFFVARVLISLRVFNHLKWILIVKLHIVLYNYTIWIWVLFDCTDVLYSSHLEKERTNSDSKSDEPNFSMQEETTSPILKPGSQP